MVIPSLPHGSTKTILMRNDQSKNWGLIPVHQIVFFMTGSFIFQLNSIYDGKLPVSRAKMASITRSAVKSVKVCFNHMVPAIDTVPLTQCPCH